MKRSLMLAAFLLSVAFVNAQNVQFGIKAGPNFYNLTGDSDGDMKINFHGGFFARIPLSTQFSFQPELIYSGEGTQEEDGGDKISINLSYLNLPLMIQYNNPSGFYAEAGPQIGLLMSAKVKYDIEGLDIPDEDIKDELNSTAFSLGFGAGYDMANGFGFGARYNLGLSNVSDDDASDIKSSGFQVSLRYRFGGK